MIDSICPFPKRPLDVGAGLPLKVIVHGHNFRGGVTGVHNG